jgi:aspartyl-tRNA synthetase
MKAIVIFLFVFVCISTPLSSTSCKEYADKYIKPLIINGFVKQKQDKGKMYIINVKNNDGKIVVFKLLKNKTTTTLFSFIGDSTLIIKNENEVYTRVAVFYNKSINVQHFETLCD